MPRRPDAASAGNSEPRSKPYRAAVTPNIEVRYALMDPLAFCSIPLGNTPLQIPPEVATTSASM
jgi:hypothetical protein